LQPRERAIALFVTAGLIAAVAIAAILERDTRVALFAVPQRPDQVAEVADRLAQWNVAFVETVDNVRVEAAKRNDLLLRLALVGVPHSHPRRTCSRRRAHSRLNPFSTRKRPKVSQAISLRGCEKFPGSKMRR